MRRLNRREYHNTIRDLLGVDFDVTGIFPADGTGGAGFDTNGETLFIPPMLLERYMEAAQQILDRVIVTPQISQDLHAAELRPLAGRGADRRDAGLPWRRVRRFRSRIEASERRQVVLKVDGAEAGALASSAGASSRAPVAGPTMARLQVNLERGTHTFVSRSDQPGANVTRRDDRQKQEHPSPEKRALHYRLFGMEPGEQPLQPRKAARQMLEHFFPKAFRRPVQPAEIDRFLAMYDRAAERGDPYEERVKLALKAVLVSPEFLFRIEQKQAEAGHLSARPV